MVDEVGDSNAGEKAEQFLLEGHKLVAQPADVPTLTSLVGVEATGHGERPLEGFEDAKDGDFVGGLGQTKAPGSPACGPN